MMTTKAKAKSVKKSKPVQLQPIDYRRQRHHYDYKQAHKVTIVGCGTLGSFSGLALAKMGVAEFNLYDYDVVEPHNVPNQLYDKTQVEKLKVESLHQTLLMNGLESKVTYFDRYVDQDLSDQDVILLTPDNMATRKAGYNAAGNSGLLIDCRMASDIYQVYAVKLNDPLNRAFYEAFMFDDKNAIQEPDCTRQSTVFSAMAVASLVSNIVAIWSRGQDIPWQIEGDLLKLDRTVIWGCGDE